MANVQGFLRWIKERSSKRSKKDGGSSAARKSKSQATRSLPPIPRDQSSRDQSSRDIPDVSRVRSRKSRGQPHHTRFSLCEMGSGGSRERDVTISPHHLYDEIPAYAIDSRRDVLRDLNMNMDNLNFSRAHEQGPYLVVPLSDTHHSHSSWNSGSNLGYHDDLHSQSMDQLDQLVGVQSSQDHLDHLDNISHDSGLSSPTPSNDNHDNHVDTDVYPHYAASGGVPALYIPRRSVAFHSGGVLLLNSPHYFINRDCARTSRPDKPYSEIPDDILDISGISEPGSDSANSSGIESASGGSYVTDGSDGMPSSMGTWPSMPYSDIMQRSHEVTQRSSDVIRRQMTASHSNGSMSKVPHQPCLGVLALRSRGCLERPSPSRDSDLKQVQESCVAMAARHRGHVCAAEEDALSQDEYQMYLDKIRHNLRQSHHVRHLTTESGATRGCANTLVQVPDEADAEVSFINQHVTAQEAKKTSPRPTTRSPSPQLDAMDKPGFRPVPGARHTSTSAPSMPQCSVPQKRSPVTVEDQEEKLSCRATTYTSGSQGSFKCKQRAQGIVGSNNGSFGRRQGAPHNRLLADMMRRNYDRQVLVHL